MLRQIVLSVLLLAGIVGCSVNRSASRQTPEESSEHASSAESGPSPTLALSIQRLQDELQDAVSAGRPFTEAESQLFGLNQIEGFTTGNGEETILFGKHDPTIPRIELDDLLVALRNAYQVSGYEGAAGVTIDPKPDVPDPWRIQQARVLGMPATAPMGVRQLNYDYDLKRVSAGLMKLNQQSIEVRGVFERIRASNSPCAAVTGSGKSATHRFWFTALLDATGPRYEIEDETVWIAKPVHVQLLSEEELLHNGRRIGGTKPQQAAREFAESVTRVLAGNEFGDYARLRNDFRIVEVAGVLHFQEIAAESMDYLLKRCPLHELPPFGEVAGVRRDTIDEAVCEVRMAAGKVKSEIVGRSRQSYRGGVEARVPIRIEDFGVGRRGRLSRLRERILASRPSPNSVTWPIQPDLNVK